MNNVAEQKIAPHRSSHASLTQLTPPREVRNFYISYLGGARSKQKALFEEVCLGFRPEASAAFSEMVEKKLSLLSESIASHPLIVQLQRSPKEVKAVLAYVLSHPLIKDGLFAVEAKLGPRHDLPYHGAHHTWGVLKDALLFALSDGVSAREALLVATAATFHDMGYIERHARNEPLGAAYARSAMETYSAMTSQGDRFSPAEITTVETMILDTALSFDARGLHPTTPSIPLSSYLLDADVAGFGREGFFTDSVRVYNESNPQQPLRVIHDVAALPDGKVFLRRTEQLLREHRWLTTPARRLLQQAKEGNLSSISALAA